MSIIGERLKELRKKKKMTQKAVANIIGISNSTLCAYERSFRNPDTYTIDKISNLYGVSADYLLGRAEPSSERNSGQDRSIQVKNDIAKRLEIIIEDLTRNDIHYFNGEPLNKEAINSLVVAIELIVRKIQWANKENIHLKNKGNEV
ncbi:helix-turn-helix domain-containing protein [Cytobacillus firmus]|nr:helix-turn-helix domain-containing protein [Cytobacillus firmus]